MFPVADPRFPRRGCQSVSLKEKPIITAHVAKRAMVMFSQAIVCPSPGGRCYTKCNMGPGQNIYPPPRDLVTPPRPPPETWSLHPPLGTWSLNPPPPPGTWSLHPTPLGLGHSTLPPTWDLVTAPPPHLRLGHSTPHPLGLGHSTSPTWDLVTPPCPPPQTWSLHPPPHLGLGHSTRPHLRLGHSTPPPHLGLGHSTLPHLRLDHSTPPKKTTCRRVVCILLECILVIAKRVKVMFLQASVILSTMGGGVLHTNAYKTKNQRFDQELNPDHLPNSQIP